MIPGAVPDPRAGLGRADAARSLADGRCRRASSWWTGETGRLEWHRWSGYLLLGLIVFRIYWGFFGSSTARFAAFLRGPRAIVDLPARHAGSVLPGHNPLGALSVLGIAGAARRAGRAGAVRGRRRRHRIRTAVLVRELRDRAGGGRVARGGIRRAAVVRSRCTSSPSPGTASCASENLLGAMLHGTRDFPGRPAAGAGCSAVRLVVGVLLAAAFTWLVIRAFQF